MEGNWDAGVDYGRAEVGGAPPRLDLSVPGRAADVMSVVEGGLTLVLAGSLFEPGDRPDQARRLLSSFRRNGKGALGKLRGRFAAVIWDDSCRRLTAFRDPMGTYPLFFARSRGRVWLASRLERLVSLEGVSNTVSRLALAEHLWHRWPDKEQTYFEEVRRVPAGHVLEVSADEEALSRCWDPAASADPDRVAWLEPSELARFDELFDRAVRRSIAGAGRVGIFLSGGLDSVSIAGSVASQVGRDNRPVGLSLALDHPDCDELEIQTRAAAVLGLEHVIREVKAEPGLTGTLTRSANLSSEWPVPLMNVWNGDFLRLGDIGRQRGCDVILTGSGGDDWLGVSPYYSADLLRSGRLVTLARLVNALRRSHGLSAAAAVRIAVWTFGIRALASDGLRRLLRRVTPRAAARGRHRRRRMSMPSWLAPDEVLRAQLCGREVGSLPDRIGASFYIREMRRGLDHPLVALEMEESFELGRRLGLKILHPFLDADLVEFLYRIAPKLLVGRGGFDRGLIRGRLATTLPDLGFESLEKSDARAFYRELARNDGRRLWSELGGALRLQELGIVDRQGADLELETILGNAAAGDSYRLWDLINLECWLRRESPTLQP